MKRRAKALVVGVAVVIAGAFFFAPVMFWFASGEYPQDQSQPGIIWPVYYSLGCYFFGVGDWFAPHWFGFGFGCQTPLVL